VDITPLVERLRLGEAGVIEALVVELKPMCKRIALRLARASSPALREELVAEAWYILTRCVLNCLGPNGALKDNEIRKYVSYVTKRKLLTFLAENTTVRIPEKTQRKHGIRPPERVAMNFTATTQLSFEDLELIFYLGTPRMARIVFLRLQGFNSSDIAAKIGISEHTVNLLLRNFGKRYRRYTEDL